MGRHWLRVWLGLLVLAAATTVSSVLGAPAAQALSCEESPELEEVDLDGIDGVLELKTVAVVPSVAGVRAKVVFRVPVRSWGSVPEEVLRLRHRGGDWGPTPTSWLCTYTPRLGDSTFVIFSTRSLEGQSRLSSRSAAPLQEPSFVSETGPLTKRFGPATEYPTSAWTIARAWVEGWWVPALVIAVLGWSVFRRRRQKQSDFTWADRKREAQVALAAWVVLLIAPQPENLGSDAAWAGLIGLFFFFTLVALRRFHVSSGLLALGGYLLMTEYIFHPVRHLSNGTIDIISKAVLLTIAMVTLLLAAFVAGGDRRASPPVAEDEREPVKGSLVS